MKIRSRLLWSSALAALALVAVACGGGGEDKVGTVIFTANGEDFVRDGFVSEDGWRIDF